MYCNRGIEEAIPKTRQSKTLSKTSFISTLWAVDDQAVAWFTLFYYQARYLDSHTEVESVIAIRQAQQLLPDQTIKDFLPRIKEAIEVIEQSLSVCYGKPEQKSLYKTLSTAYNQLSSQLRRWEQQPSYY